MLSNVPFSSPAARIAYADKLLADHARFTARAERATRIAYTLAGAAAACGIVCLASLFLFFPTA